MKAWMKGAFILGLLAIVSVAGSVGGELGAMERLIKFPPPPIHPGGVVLETRELAPGVYALLASRPPVDNSGFIVGQRGVLVIDGHINAAMAGQIQDRIREVTEKPILYLVNTNFHGDHTFGNYAFPDETLIVAHRKTAERMREFEREKTFLLPTVNNDESVYGDVELRLPDIEFDDYLKLDLGGRVVEIYHFGPGNTQGDTVIYDPLAKVAWTGNLVIGLTPPIAFLIEGGAGVYMETITRFAKTIDVQTIIPGHGLPATGEILGQFLAYLSGLLQSVRSAVDNGWTREETVLRSPLPESYAPPADSPLAEFIAGVHRWNVNAIYPEISRQ